MTISTLVSRLQGKYIILEAMVTSPSLKKPMKVWFKTESRFASYVNTTADAFAAAVLMLAMKNGEDLIILAPTHRSVLTNLRKVVHLISSWPQSDVWQKLQPVRIIAKNVIVSSKRNKRNRAAFFSLGVDSFYTLLQTEKDAATRLTHLVLVQGFDISLNNHQLFSQALKNSTQVAANMGKQLIYIQTNLRVLTDTILTWEAAHGGALGGVSQFLSGGLGTIYINSEDANRSNVPYGIHPELDPLWGSDTTKVITYGLEAPRSQKTLAICEDTMVQKFLRVCWVNEGNAYNCRNCQKCLRTMLQLKIAGSLEKVITLSGKIPLRVLRTMIEPKHRMFLWEDLLAVLPITEMGLRFEIKRMLLRSQLHLIKQAASAVLRSNS